jgi:hypothetical protein
MHGHWLIHLLYVELLQTRLNLQLVAMRQVLKTCVLAHRISVCLLLLWSYNGGRFGRFLWSMWPVGCKAAIAIAPQPKAQ